MKIDALVIGKAKSVGFPDKNIMTVFGRPCFEYAMSVMMYLQDDHILRNLYSYTDSVYMADMGDSLGIKHLEHSEAGKEILTEDALIHAWGCIEDKPDILCLFFANSPCIDLELVNAALTIIKSESNSTLDSVVSVSEFPMFEPLRAREVGGSNGGGLLSQQITMEHGNSIRGSGGLTYFVDFTVQVLRAKCFEDMWNGSLPFRWHGNNIYAIKNPLPTFDIDAQWQIPVIEWILQELGWEHGYTSNDVPF